MLWRRITLSFTRSEQETLSRDVLGAGKSRSGRSEPTRLLLVGYLHGCHSHHRHDFEFRRVDESDRDGLTLFNMEVILCIVDCDQRTIRIEDSNHGRPYNAAESIFADS
jgi:hypothetical protein